ncbi:putative transcriptional regulator, MarR family protein [Paractinoplanes deccanensis]|uniref:Transcriptional regulator, MarR family protein n=1 Tax=Paractinoplanes deccanensis TaxID=113561 RepID=A0ABQ3YGG8_9ACTN|nr:bifunctional helix-turn-helix transcriptional regulator/GNAT family N-acetyltransferase [Actinoplanes deccanensis]GID79082.1 putative transcriptional regulator, MarR family protein [Actinoplanes deccanensis]
MDQIELVRDFNRYYTRRIGVLTDHYLGQDRPLGEARLLFEIGDGADLRDLRARLGLDSGYLSRLLRSLTRQGLVSVTPRPGDARVRTATLTEDGRRELADLDERSRRSVAGLLEPLTLVQRDRLVEAQTEIHRLLRLAAISLTAVADSAPEARFCLRAYAAELSTRFPEGYDRAALLPPGTLGDGTFLVAREEGEPVGCGLWQRSAPGLAEIRHLWVSAAARGLGLGRRLLTGLEADAATRGVTTLRLGTHAVLTEAIALYRSAGYREIAPYDDSPYNQVAFEKSL